MKKSKQQYVYISISALTFGLLILTVFGLPQQALALGWTPADMISTTNVGGTQNFATDFNQQTLGKWILDITTWLLGIAIVLFILKVVFTAIDRMFTDGRNDSGGAGMRGGGSGGSGGGTFLQQIPIIGAYPSKAWKDIWIEFGKHVGIVAGAWVIVQIIVGVIQFVFSTLTNM